MKRLLHLSDLHFGRTHADLVEPLIRCVNEIAPDLVAISGDFTQRARVAQFRESAAFVDAINAPVVGVPGNHDTPLDNVFLRFLSPWRRYRRYIAQDLEPVVADDHMALVGINTVNRFSWQRGRVSPRTAARMRAGFSGLPDHLVRIAMLHHPLEHGPEVEKRLMRGSRRAVAALAASRAEIILSGHLHNTRVAPLIADPDLLFVQAGTGLSSRLRGGETNTFNLLTIERQGAVTIERFATGNHDGFAPVATTSFEKTMSGWVQRT